MEAAGTEITFRTHGREMEFNFSLSQKVWRKKSRTRTGVMQTHTHTYLSDRTWLLTYFPIYPRETNAGLFLCSSSSDFLDLPLSHPPFLSPPLPFSSTALGRSVHTQTHGSRHTHSSLPLPLSPSPSLSLSLPLTHTL